MVGLPSMIILYQDDEPIRLLGLRYIQPAAATPLRPLGDGEPMVGPAPTATGG